MAPDDVNNLLGFLRQHGLTDRLHSIGPVGELVFFPPPVDAEEIANLQERSRLSLEAHEKRLATMASGGFRKR